MDELVETGASVQLVMTFHLKKNKQTKKHFLVSCGYHVLLLLIAYLSPVVSWRVIMYSGHSKRAPSGRVVTWLAKHIKRNSKYAIRFGLRSMTFSDM